MSQVITFETSSAESGCVVGFALISNGNTDFVSVEGPFVGAGKAHLVGPIPGSTSEIGRLGSISRRVDALSIDNVISSKAGKAVS